MSTDPNQGYQQPPSYGAPGNQGYPPSQAGYPPAGNPPIGYPPGGVEYPPQAAPPPPQPGQPGQPPYPAPAPGAYPQYYAGPMAPATNGLAIASLICSIANFVVIPLIGSILGVIFGHMALGQIRRSNGAEQGEGLAKAGLIVGYVGLGLWVLGILFFVIFLIAAISTSTIQPAFVR